VRLPGHDKIAWSATKHEAQRSARIYHHRLPSGSERSTNLLTQIRRPVMRNAQ
jgi:hypothetical protein